VFIILFFKSAGNIFNIFEIFIVSIFIDVVSIFIDVVSIFIDVVSIFIDLVSIFIDIVSIFIDKYNSNHINKMGRRDWWCNKCDFKIFGKKRQMF